MTAHPYRHIFRFLTKYKYQAIFPIAVVEGPIVTVISGILVARGRLSLLPTFAVVFAGDLISDPALYLLGRFGRHLLKKLRFIRLPEERLAQVERQYATHPWKTMIMGKLSYGLGSLFIVAAGAGRMPWRKFLLYMATVDAVKSSLLLGLGYFCGRAILHLSGDLKYYAVAVFVALGCWLFIKRRRKKA
jgi:membrane protein DedA with SNARE-associated domain